MIQIIPIINTKGGIGKTTTAVSVAAGLARRGQRVLLIDLDSQGSASLSLGIEKTERSISAALYGEMPFGMTVHRTHLPGLFVSPSSPALANADAHLAPLQNRVTRLREVLSPVRMAYDVIILDCAPSASLLNVNALVAADAFIVPVSPDFLSIQSLTSFDETIRTVRRTMGQVAPVMGILLTHATGEPGREERSEAVFEMLKARYGGKLFDTTVRRDVALQEAPILGVDIFEYAPESDGAADYQTLVDEVASRIERYSVVFPDTGRAYVSAAKAEAIVAAVDFGDQNESFQEMRLAA